MKPRLKKKVPATVRQMAARAAAASGPSAATPSSLPFIPSTPIIPPTDRDERAAPPGMAKFVRELVRPALTCRARYPAERIAKFRPFRQTPPRDLTLHQDVTDTSILKLWISGVGDLSTVARTACDAEAKGATATVSIITNDIIPEILARNMLILNALASSGAAADTGRLASYVGQLWFSLTMQPDAREFWDAQMRACLAKDWGSLSADAPVRTQSQETVEVVRHCWRSWLDVGWSVDKLFAKRDEYLGTDAGWDGDLAYVFPDEFREFSRIFESKLQVSDRPAPVVNPTILLVRANGEPYYAIDADTRPLAMFTDPDLYAGSPESVARETVHEWTSALQRMLTGRRPKLHVVSVVGHAIQLLEEFQGGESFSNDVIDVGNLCDSCGLLNVLVHASALLNRFPYPRPRSRIYAYTKRIPEVGTGTVSQEAFVEAATGLAYEAFPALLALGLVEKPFEHDWTTWVQRSLPDPGSGDVQLTFYGITAAAVPTSLADSPFLMDALDKCMAHLSNPKSLDFHFKTNVLRQKMLSYGLAWGRLVFEGAKPCLAPPFFAAGSTAGELKPATVAKTFEVSDQVAASLLYGLPVSKPLATPNGDYLGALDIALPVPADSRGNALLAAGKSHLVLEITAPQSAKPIRIESLRAKLTRENPQRLYVVAFIPQRVMTEAIKPGALRLYREFLPPHLGGPSPQRERELVGGRAVPYNYVLPSEIPFYPFYRCLRGLVTRVEDCRTIDPANPLAFPRQLPVLHVAESCDAVEIVLALPPRLADASLTLPIPEMVKKHFGAAILVVNGRPQIMRLTSPVRMVKVRADRKQRRVTVILERVLYPDKEYGSGVRPAQHSKRMVRQPRDAAFARALEAAGRAAPDPDLRWSPTLDLGNLSPRDEATYTAALVFALFDAYARGSQMVVLRAREMGGMPIALFIFYDRVLVPAQGPGMAPTPGLCAGFASFAGIRGVSVDMQMNSTMIQTFLASQHPAGGSDTFVTTYKCSLSHVNLLHGATTQYVAGPDNSMVPANDPRFNAATYKFLRGILVQTLILPVCKLRGMRGMAKFEVVEE
ncbi:hypothetical protein H9P43_005903 [Blastocladiella emersonii ATCC 22665]|nr:hypothetical protein H9P43_005903 [Blastocladiella emersonii ATCC 22665]